AWDLLEEHHVDMILTGQELEDGTAEKFLDKLALSPHQNIPVIIITSNDDMKTRDIYFKKGVVDFIPKASFTPARLRQHVDYFGQQDKMIAAIQKMEIAILDDSNLSINVITSILKIHDIKNVDSFTAPGDLLNAEKDYDIYFVDIMLPGVSGEGIVVELRRRFPLSVIIVVSSLDKYNTIVHVLESGADDYIIKPFDARLLMARIKSNVRHFLAMGELKQQSYELKKMAITDSLTGARNHRYLFNRLDAEIAHSERHERHLSVLLLDIDFFKSVNDTYGHPMGDVVLKQLAKLFLDNCRKHDIFGRYGGEEFMLIMPDTDISGAYSFSERIREGFQKMKIKGIEREITFSAGLAEWKGETNEGLLKKADQLLYKAKDAGRNQICQG
nr:diguanylate cyclase [Spirochaetaceae bacterium]